MPVWCMLTSAACHRPKSSRTFQWTLKKASIRLMTPLFTLFHRSSANARLSVQLKRGFSVFLFIVLGNLSANSIRSS